MDKVSRLIAAVNLLFPAVQARGIFSRDVSEKVTEGEAVVTKWSLLIVDPHGRA